jgi:hypothetical protein
MHQVLVSSCNCLRPRKRNWTSTSDCLFRLLCFSREDHLESVKELTCCTFVKEYCCCTSGSDRDLRIVLARAVFRLVLILDEDCFFFSLGLAPCRSDCFSCLDPIGKLKKRDRYRWTPDRSRAPRTGGRLASHDRAHRGLLARWRGARASQLGRPIR